MMQMAAPSAATQHTGVQDSITLTYSFADHIEDLPVRDGYKFEFWKRSYVDNPSAMLVLLLFLQMQTQPSWR